MNRIPIYKTTIDENNNISLKISKEILVELDNPENCYDYIDVITTEFELDTSAEEYIIVISYDNTRKRKIYEAGHGTYMSMINGYRNIITFLLLSGAHRFMIIHNHPDGNIKQSKQDIDFTTMLIMLTNQLNIEMDCHIIVTKTQYNDITGLEDDIYER